MTKTIQDLPNQIERLVREHLTAQQKAATAAIERAFASVAAPAAPARTLPPRVRTGRRRAPAEVARLAERLCEAVRENPGETMTVIASQVGETPRALNRPMSHLKSAGRVRSAGQRHLTRYFPMTASRAA
jgi:hypothetical protein